MIQFKRNDEPGCTQVVAEIHTGLPTATPIFWFSHQCGNAEYAVLLQRHLFKQLRETVERAHQLAYERGWKDAKGRKARKATGFAPYFTNNADAVAW